MIKDSTGRIWYRSLYWRIAVGFVALLAAVLAAQALLFLWLTDRRVTSPSIRNPQQLADHVARDLSAALANDPSIDLHAHITNQFGRERQPFVVVMRDGRRLTNRPGMLPPAFPGPSGRTRRSERLRGTDASPSTETDRPEDPPPKAGSEPDPPRRPGRPEGSRFRGGRGGAGGVVTAPIVVGDAQIGVVAVPTGRTPVGVLLRELGPTLMWSGLILLGAGAVIAAAVIFRPAQRRLRSLQQAALALGEGRTDVRADETGGDEVAALAAAFNRMAGDLQTRAAALARSDDARRQLLADVSHELMTPLTAIRGYVETLAMPALASDDANRSRYLDIVNRETHKLETIVGDLLELARLDGGGGDVVMERVPVAELISRVRDRHEPSLRSRRIAADTSVVPPDLHVRGDAHRLEQALQNLAANAIRHTPEGGRIELRAEVHDGGVRIAVRDSGPGIASEHLPHVFDRFYKADPSRAATGQSGSGLGLSIVRAIVQRHGGSVTAANAPTGGAVFEIVLPAA